MPTYFTDPQLDEVSQALRDKRGIDFVYYGDTRLVADVGAMQLEVEFIKKRKKSDPGKFRITTVWEAPRETVGDMTDPEDILNMLLDQFAAAVSRHVAREPTEEDTREEMLLGGE